MALALIESKVMWSDVPMIYTRNDFANSSSSVPAVPRQRFDAQTVGICYPSDLRSSVAFAVTQGVFLGSDVQSTSAAFLLAVARIVDPFEAPLIG